MAYNLQPLIQTLTLEQILHPHPNPHRRPNWILDPSKKSLIESLLAKARFLNEFFENPSSLTGSVHTVRSLEGRIRDACYRAQNVIEYHLADQLLSKPCKTIIISPPDLLQDIEDREFEPIFDKLADILDGVDMKSGPSSSDLVSSSEDLNPKNIIVGISEDVIQLKQQRLIMPLESKLEIIPIVGMGGIGKTTLAQTLYNDQCVVSCFDIRAWVAISQSYTMREILFGLFKCIIGNLSNKTVHQDESDDELGLQLHKYLWGRRYLIVLDDMWNFEAWDCIKMFFPDENNGSRILVTTREQNVANYVAGSNDLHHQMKLLNELESWKLLRQKVFSEGSFALELEKIGRNIAKDCGGLPLAIHVVSGVLSPLEKTQEAWMQVAMDVGTCMANSHEKISPILSLSYNHLPNYLKPCFLYMGAFLNRQIQASKLIRLWMAEGFLKPNLGMSFEETARVYLKELVERNLVSVAQQETKRKAKSYVMHDLLRDLCIGKAQEEKFLYVGIDAINNLNQGEMIRLRLSVNDSNNEFTRIIGSPHMSSTVCSLLVFASDLSWLDEYALMRLLKVLDMLGANFGKLPKAMEKLVNLRYLAARISNSSPDSISNLCNLQTLVFHLKEYDSFVGKVQELLVHMPQLRHIKFKGHYYPFFGLEDGESVNIVNEKLCTLSSISIDSSFSKILKIIPNLKKLGIDCRAVFSCSSTIDLSSLTQLQILKCSRWWLSWCSVSLRFPPFLEKLKLESSWVCSGFLNEIGRLPNLQVFKAKHCCLSNDSMGEWEPIEGGFQQLRLLQLEDFRGLKNWIADETHYPRLEHIIIHTCVHLEEIPSGMGDIPTLEIIEVHYCSYTAQKSARKIQEEQIQSGNHTLQLRITPKSKGTLAHAESTLEEALKTLGRREMYLYETCLKAENTLANAVNRAASTNIAESKRSSGRSKSCSNKAKGNC